MIILGLDPSIVLTGWGVVEIKPNSDPRMVEVGDIPTRPKDPYGMRLTQIRRTIRDVSRRLNVDEAAIESPFVAGSGTTTLVLGGVFGVVSQILHEEGIPVTKYAPAEIKKLVAKHGKASKDQLRDAVRSIYDIKRGVLTEDQADALGAAWCLWAKVIRYRLLRQRKAGES